MVLVRVDNQVGTILLDRHDRRNAISRQMITLLQQALSDLHQEKKVRAVILTSQGTCFSAGMELHEMHQTLASNDPDPQWHADAISFRDLLITMLQFPKPIIAAVNGPAIGGGCGLALASDILVAEPQATFGVPAPQRGIVAGIVSPLLAFRIGNGRAAELMLTGRTISSQEAHTIGLVHHFAESEMSWVEAQRIAQTCASGAAPAVAVTKRLINESAGENLATLLSIGAAAEATSKTTESAREGITAFIERRQPEWP